MNRHTSAMRLIAEARPPVLDDAPDRPVPHFPDQLAPARPARRGRRLVLAGLLPTVAAGLAASAIIVAVAHRPEGSAPNARPAQSAAPAQSVTARSILLAAAEKTAASTPATGGYWVTKVELHHVYDVGDYDVLGGSKVETWQPLRDVGGDVVFVTQSLAAGPATDADKAAWKAAGSPTKWTLTGPKGKQSRGRSLSAEPGPREVSTMPDGSFLAIGGTPLTYAQIRALPTDPDKLKDYLIKLDDAAGRDGIWTSKQIEKWRVEMLFTESWELLSQLPVSPAVRAATYRMLAGLPGLTVTENVKDAKGRAGAGISYAYRNADGSSSPTRLVIDPDSGSLLAKEDKSDSSLLLDARFSDATPPRS